MNKAKQYDYCGENLTLAEIAPLVGISKWRLYSYIRAAGGDVSKGIKKARNYTDSNSVIIDGKEYPSVHAYATACGLSDKQYRRLRLRCPTDKKKDIAYIIAELKNVGYSGIETIVKVASKELEMRYPYTIKHLRETKAKSDAKSRANAEKDEALIQFSRYVSDNSRRIDGVPDWAVSALSLMFPTSAIEEYAQQVEDEVWTIKCDTMDWLTRKGARTLEGWMHGVKVEEFKL